MLRRIATSAEGLVSEEGWSQLVATDRVWECSVAECTQDPWIVWISIAGRGREQQLLLEPEVPAPVAGPVGEERFARFGRGRIGRAAKHLGDRQRLVVITR